MGDFSPIGVNLSAGNDSQPYQYINLIKSARPFGSKEKPWDQAGAPAVNAQGYPTGDFGFVAWAGAAHWDGQYQLYTTGKVNKLLFSGSTVKPTIAQHDYFADQNVSRVYVDVPPASGMTQLFVGVDYDETTIQDGVKELKFLRPGYNYDDEIFTEEFFRSLEPFGIVRVMQLIQTNHSVVSGDANRTKLNDCRWVDRGCPFEAVLTLFKNTGKVPWFNFYHLLDEATVRLVFQLFHDYCVAQQVPFYFEDSNECWNFGFEQGQYYYAEAKRQLAAGDPLGLGNPPDLGVATEELARHRLHGYRTYWLASIGRDVFGEDAYLLRPLLGGQAASPWYLGVACMDWLAGKYGPLQNWLYGTCVTNYFGGDRANLLKPDLTPQQVLLELDTAAGGQANSKNFKEHLYHSQRHAVALCGYEVGPDTRKSKNSVDAKIAAVMSPEMEAIYLRNLESMWVAGGREACGFDNASKPGPEGTYGHTFDIRQLDTPKRRALGRFAAGKRLPAPAPPEKPLAKLQTLLTESLGAAAAAEAAVAVANQKLNEVNSKLNEALTMIDRLQ